MAIIRESLNKGTLPTRAPPTSGGTSQRLSGSRLFAPRFLDRKLTAWIALAAMLFGAVSPALAAALFPHRPDILGRMLAIPAASAAAAHGAPQETAAGGDDGCPHESAAARSEEPSHLVHHGSSGSESHDDSEHAAHGIFCSFCLTANSVVTLLSPQSAPLAIAPAGTEISRAPERRPGDATPALHRARGPPALSR